MSLTQFVSRPDLAEEMDKLICPPCWRLLRNEILVPPRSPRRALIGTAFDYLLRFHLLRLNRIAVDSPWIARNAINLAPTVTGQSEAAASMLARATLEAERFLRLGQSSLDLLKAAVLFAQLDCSARTKRFADNLGLIHHNDLMELQAMLDVVPFEAFRATSLCVLNPRFGEASSLVGGADGDLIIDTMFIELKTGLCDDLVTRSLRQLVGYIVLSRLSGISGVPADARVTRLGVYAARFGRLLECELADVITENSLQYLARKFRMIQHQLS